MHRDRNHPSIVLWSAGNEIGEQSSPNGAQVLRRLVDIFHREDPTRPVTTGQRSDRAPMDIRPRSAFLNAEDIVGYNYVDRWHERRELFAERGPARPSRLEDDRHGERLDLPELRRALLAGHRPSRRAPELHHAA